MAGVVDYISIQPVDRVAEERIESRALLAHVVQQRVGRARVHLAPYANGHGRRRARLDRIAPALAQRGEIQTPGLRAWAERAVALRRSRPNNGATALTPHD